MDASWAVAVVIQLLLATLAAALGSSGEVGRYAKGIQDINELVPKNNDKQVHQLQLQLDAEVEENKQNILKVRDLNGKLAAALLQVSELAENQDRLNKTVERLTQENDALKTQLVNQSETAHQLQLQLDAKDKENNQNLMKIRDLQRNLNESLQTLESFSDTELHLNKVLDDYYKDGDWGTLRRGLESLLDRESEAYKQLQRIPYGHGYPLWRIGSACFVALAEVLVSGEQGPNITEADGDTLLHGACEGDCMQMAVMLLDRGADIEARDNGGATPVIIASRYNRLKMVQFLKERGALLDSADRMGATGLLVAAEGGHLNVVKYLVEAGADPTLEDREGNTALDRSRYRGRTAVALYLSGMMQQAPTQQAPTQQVPIRRSPFIRF